MPYEMIVAVVAISFACAVVAMLIPDNDGRPA